MNHHEKDHPFQSRLLWRRFGLFALRPSQQFFSHVGMGIMVKKAVSKIKYSKAAGPSRVVVDMIRAAGDTGATMIFDLAIAIIQDGKVQADW